MSLPILVINRHPPLQQGRHGLWVERVFNVNGKQSFGLIEQKAAITVGAGDQRRPRIVGDGQGTFQYGFCTGQQRGQSNLIQTLQHHDLRARQQGGVEFERRIFGRCTDERDHAAFHKGQEAVLLRAVEAMYFVHEQQCLLARSCHCLCLGKGFFEIGYAREHRRNRLVMHVHRVGQQSGYAGLARAGWSPQDHRG